MQSDLLQPDQTLLEYFVGDSSIFVFVIGQEKYEVKEIKKDFPLESWVDTLRFSLGENHSSSVEAYGHVAHELYEKLIAPVDSILSEKVIIVPDGVLGYVPFEALLSSQVKDLADFKSYPYLIKDKQISYCYSATLLREMMEKQHKRQPAGSLVAFAPFYEGSYAKLDSTMSLTFDTLTNGRDTLIFKDIVTRKDFNKLPDSGEEVKAASLFWDGDYFLNTDATEDRFNEVAGNYRIVHLSTHGVVDSRSGDYSYLAFAEQKDSLENEFLYIRDLYNLQLNADMVVLSACETGIGELQRGEGIISLARGFTYAGAKSIITSLWSVSDEHTKDLMLNFYKYLKMGFSKDEALRKAKLTLIENLSPEDGMYAHPYFWSGFIGIGDMRPLDF